MTMLLTADLHLTDNPRDEYRWGIFPWLRKQVKANPVKLIGLLGDLTDAKDKHSEALVNRMADELAKLGEVCPVVFDPGNHDGIQEGRPFFRFANHIPRVKCLTESYELETELGFCLFLPNTRDYKKAWAHEDFKAWDYIFCHQTFDGCLTENGTKLPGIPPSVFGDTKALIFSGDIHVPQVVSKHPRIEYVGAPYRIRFGDEFDPRVLEIGRTPKDQHQQQDLHFPTLMKFLIEVEGDDPLASFKKELKRLDVREEDQVKLRVKLSRSDYPSWPKLRPLLIKEAADRNVLLFGPELHASKEAQPKAKEQASAPRSAQSPLKALAAYGKRERLSPAMLEAGKGFLSPKS